MADIPRKFQLEHGEALDKALDEERRLHFSTAAALYASILEATNSTVETDVVTQAESLICLYGLSRVPGRYLQIIPIINAELDDMLSDEQKRAMLRDIADKLAHPSAQATFRNYGETEVLRRQHFAKLSNPKKRFDPSYRPKSSN